MILILSLFGFKKDNKEKLFKYPYFGIIISNSGLNNFISVDMFYSILVYVSKPKSLYTKNKTYNIKHKKVKIKVGLHGSNNSMHS